MPTDLPPDYKPNPDPPADPGAGKGEPGMPDPGADIPGTGPINEPGNDVIDVPGWPKPPGVPGIDPQPSPAGVPTF